MTGHLETSLQQRLAWTEMVLASVDPDVSLFWYSGIEYADFVSQHPEILSVVRKVTEYMTSRLQSAYIQTAEAQQVAGGQSDHHTLRRIAHLATAASKLAARSPQPAE